MTTSVHRDYPVERLPDDLRQGLDRGVRVLVTTTADVNAEEPFDIMSLRGAGRGVYGTPEQAVAAIRALRDEWD